MNSSYVRTAIAVILIGAALAATNCSRPALKQSGVRPGIPESEAVMLMPEVQVTAEPGYMQPEVLTTAEPGYMQPEVLVKAERPAARNDGGLPGAHTLLPSAAGLAIGSVGALPPSQ